MAYYWVYACFNTKTRSWHKGTKVMDNNQLAKIIVDAAFRVHSTLGPGLLESVYESCLAREFELRAVPFTRQAALPVIYQGVSIENAYRIDLFVDNRIIVEVKAVERHLPLFEAQLLTYMRLSGCRLGLLINFNQARIKDGIKRMVL